MLSTFILCVFSIAIILVCKQSKYSPSYLSLCFFALVWSPNDKILALPCRYGSPPKVEPVKDSRVDSWHGPSSPVHDCPPKVEDFLTQVQTEASRPTRPLFSIMNWRNSTNAAGKNHVTDYRESPNNYTTSDWNKSSGNLIRDESFSEPYISNKEGWDWPGRKGWTTPPPQTNTSLSGPTDDIGKAMEVLTQAIKPSYVTPAAPQQRFTVPTSPVPKRET